MIACPHCGSTAQVKKLNEEYVTSGDGSQINLITHCQCGCGTKFQCITMYTQVAKPIIEEK